MRVRIFHTDDLFSECVSDGPGPGLREVFAYDDPEPGAGNSATDHPEHRDHPAILEHVFMLFNVGDDPAFGTPDPRAVEYRSHRLRSLSMGDVVALDDTFYACASLGWQQLDTPPDITASAGEADDNPAPLSE